MYIFKIKIIYNKKKKKKKNYNKNVIMISVQFFKVFKVKYLFWEFIELINI